MTPILQILITVIGSGAIFSFIQFLITRHDDKNDQVKNLCDKIEEGLKQQTETSEERYESLQTEIKEGLNTQQTWGFAHFNEHKESIMKLEEAILQLTRNDTEQSQYMKNIGESLVGLSHDKILFLCDNFLERGGITLKEKATIKSIYEPYQKLGGNGDCQVAWSAVCDLPILSEEKAKELDREKGIKRGE